MIPKAVTIQSGIGGVIAVPTTKRLPYDLTNQDACDLIYQTYRQVWYPDMVDHVRVYWQQSHPWYKLMSWLDRVLLGDQAEGPGVDHDTFVAKWVLDHYKVQSTILRVLAWLDCPDFSK